MPTATIRTIAITKQLLLDFDATVGTAERVCRQISPSVAHAEDFVSGSVILDEQPVVRGWSIGEAPAYHAVVVL